MTEITKPQAVDALERLARTMEAALVECGLPSSVAFMAATIAKRNALRAAAGRAPVRLVDGPRPELVA